jgi:fatty-acyl-CoA synthase
MCVYMHAFVAEVLSSVVQRAWPCLANANTQHRWNHFEAPFLGKTPANYVPLSPLSFLKRSANLFPNRTAGKPSVRSTFLSTFAMHSDLRGYTAHVERGTTTIQHASEVNGAFVLKEYTRIVCFASALRQHGIGHGDVVSFMALNIPAMFEVRRMMFMCLG